MTLRCRKGDMAICNRTEFGEHVGHIVDVVDVGCFDPILGHKWLVKTRNGLMATQPDSWMTPIRPGDLDESDETEKTLESVE